jgi:hypothetical protein
MSDERKEIKIDPSMFKISDNKTRKQREPKQPKIKVKAPHKGEKKPKASTLKKNLLRMIRGHQEKRIKEQTKPVTPIVHPEAPPKSDFEQSMQFMSQIKDSEPEAPKYNRTLRQLPNQTFKDNHISKLSSSNFGTPIQIQPPSTIGPSMQIQKPHYGCLKNGNLPTYRVWKNQTQKAHMSPPIPRNKMEIPPSPIQVNYESRLRDKIKEMSEMQQHQKMKKQEKIFKKPRKQRRIMRRTFRIGKSKAYPRISVLVSNKTLRNQANLKKTELKETPINEVKQYLKKQGFIKVGTSTPNDVLRQMYESACMICGELKNYSPENLLYNYFNETPDV